MKVAIQLFSVRDFANDDLFGTFKELKNMGYDGVELAGLYDHSFEEVKGFAEEAGLEIMSAHVTGDIIETPELLNGYKSLGVKYLAVQGFGIKPDMESIDNSVYLLKRLGEITEKQGIQLLYHNHRYEFETLDGERVIDIMYKKVPTNILKTEIDIAWAGVMGEVPEEYLLKYVNRAPVIHLKDYVGKFDTESFSLMSVGHGVQNVPEILKTCKKIGTEWIVIEQDSATKGMTQMECAKSSIETMKKYSDML